MKKFFLAIPAVALFIASCGSDDSLNEVLDDKESFDNAINSFAEGNAKDGKEYFSGLLAEVIEVDVKYREMEELDAMDASEKEILHVLDTCLIIIKDARKALDKYKDKDWPRRAEFHDLSLEWFAVVESLIKDYARPLAKAMSKPMEELTDEEYELWEEWQEAYDEKYIDVDNRWVEFQDVYAAANDFTLDPNQTIDVDALVEEDMAK